MCYFSRYVMAAQTFEDICDEHDNDASSVSVFNLIKKSMYISLNINKKYKCLAKLIYHKRKNWS